MLIQPDDVPAQILKVDHDGENMTVHVDMGGMAWKVSL